MNTSMRDRQGGITYTVTKLAEKKLVFEDVNLAAKEFHAADMKGLPAVIRREL